MQLGSAAPDQYSVPEESRLESGSADHFTYEPRQPSSGVIHQIIKLHVETFLQEAAGGPDGNGLPRFIEKEFRSVLECGALGRGSPVQTTYYYRRDTAEHVTVIRRHHPLEGQSFEVLKGGQHLILRLRDGSTMRMPRSWTDADGPPTSRPSRLSTVFTIDSLRELIALLEALRQRS